MPSGVGKSIKGIEVVEVMEALKAQNGQVPKRIQVDNVREFIGKELEQWAYDNDVILDLSMPATPSDNPFIESFNGPFRHESLNVNWFLSLDDAYEKTGNWVPEHNSFRPHSSLDDLTPEQMIEKHFKEIKKRMPAGATNYKHMFLQPKNTGQHHLKNICATLILYLQMTPDFSN